jgi:hypothetical protein
MLEFPQAFAASDFSWCLSYMTNHLLGPEALLSVARWCRLLAIGCCVLTLWAPIDSHVVLLLQTSSEYLPTSQSLPGQEDSDDDDSTLDLTVNPALSWVLLRNEPTPAPGQYPRIAVTPSPYPSIHLPALPAMPVCEHEFRNGIGANLLC